MSCDSTSYLVQSRYDPSCEEINGSHSESTKCRFSAELDKLGLLLKMGGSVELFFCEGPGQLQESLGPSRPEVSRAVSPRVSPKTGVSEAVSHGVSPGPGFQSVPKVSRECPRSVKTPF